MVGFCDISTLKSVHSKQPLSKSLLFSDQWESLEHCRWKSRLTLFYKIQFGLLAVPLPESTVRPERPQTGYPHQFQRIYCRTDLLSAMLILVLLIVHHEYGINKIVNTVLQYRCQFSNNRLLTHQIGQHSWRLTAADFYCYSIKTALLGLSAPLGVAGGKHRQMT